MGVVVDLAQYRNWRKTDPEDQPMVACPRCGEMCKAQYVVLAEHTVAYLCMAKGDPHFGGNKTRTFRVHAGGTIWTGKRILKVGERDD
jgi:hypothetical protein